ncbi:MAG: hypothetical protein ACKO9V_07015 [Candidatus Kapaibacterium sp.]
MIASRSSGAERIQNVDDEMNREVIVGLDIGTTKICVIVASPDRDGNTVDILGVGMAESSGLNRGVVVNI